MNIALIGFGSMGKEIEKIALSNSKNHIVSRSYNPRKNGLDIQGIKKADVAIDFTSPEIILSNIERIARMKRNIVVGTTGWYNRLDEVKKIVKKNNIGLVYGQNFSIGANIFFKILAYSTKVIAEFNSYDVYGIEMHHSGKKDSPSGTAKKLSEIIIKNTSRKNILQSEKLNRQIKKNELHFSSVRGGNNPGRHEIIFDSIPDEIHLVHQAHNRQGFAEGALLAAEFIQNKKGLYSFDEVFEVNT